MAEVKSYKVLSLPSRPSPDSIYWVKGSSASDVIGYITDKHGVPYPLKDLQGSGGITTLTNTDGNLVITGVNNKVINIAPALLTLINSALQPEDENTLEKVSAENIPSHTPIAIVNNQAYKFDASNINHQFAFMGFSKNGTSTGQICLIQQQGEIELVGWGLTPNQQYLAGTSGAIVVDNITLNNFTKVLGYATTTDTLQIIKDFSSVN
jgi:hypothetical protein